ncbi:MAG: hypothetical protein K2M82_03515 [Lachnospiraceae bacterium]|nr:hypothetical protein [Lachnospiraceae bacterium]
MKKQNLDNVYGNVPHSFHCAVVKSLNKLEEVEPMKSKSKIYRAAIACAIIATIGAVGIVTAKAVYPMIVNRNGDYGLDVTLQQTASNAPEYVKLNLGYLPDNVISEDGLKYSVNNNHKEKCLTFLVVRTNDTDSFFDTNIENYEELTVNDHHAVLANVANNNDFDRRFYIYFEEYSAFIKAYVGSDVTDEEVSKIMNGISVTEGTADDHSGGALSEVKNQDKNSLWDMLSNITDKATPTVNITFSKIELGQTLHNSIVNDETCTATIDKIEVLDNVNNLDEKKFQFYMDDALAEDISDYADENGNLVAYERNSYKYGDGVNTPISEITLTETVNRRMVYVTITVSNNTDSVSTYWYQDLDMHCLNDNNGNISPVEYSEDCIPDIPWRGEISYIDKNDVDTAGYKAGYNSITLQPNTSETVHIGFWADEDMLDDYYVTNCLEYSAGDLYQTESYECIKVQ